MEYFATHANFSGLPVCEETLDCQNFIFDTPGLVESAEMQQAFKAKIYCLKNIEVPEHMLATLDSKQVMQTNDGTYRLNSKICACDTAAWGLDGPDCLPQTGGILLLLFFSAIVLWILWLLFNLIIMQRNHEFKTKSKRVLARCAICQYVGHIVWILSLRGYYVIFSHRPIADIMILLGYFITTFGQFSFVSLMLLQTIGLVKQSNSGALSKAARQLLKIERVFVVLPIIVAVLSVLLFVIYTNLTFVLLAVTQSLAILSIAWAFNVTVKALTERIHRLIPKEVSGYKAKRNSIMPIGEAGNKAYATGIASESNQLLVLSQRLRQVAKRMRNVTTLAVLVALVYVAISDKADALHGVLPNLLLGFIHLIQAAIPSLGIAGLSKITHVKTRYVPNTAQQSNVLSTDVGTLGGDSEILPKK